ncbi:MAG: hypothetical protein ACTHML_20925 [Ginsengibacter sp.]
MTPFEKVSLLSNQRVTSTAEAGGQKVLVQTLRYGQQRPANNGRCHPEPLCAVIAFTNWFKLPGSRFVW